MKCTAKFRTSKSKNCFENKVWKHILSHKNFFPASYPSAVCRGKLEDKLCDDGSRRRIIPDIDKTGRRPEQVERGGSTCIRRETLCLIEEYW